MFAILGEASASSPSKYFTRKYFKSWKWIITIAVWPLYRTTCVNGHPQLRTEGFCWSKVSLRACHCWRKQCISTKEKIPEFSCLEAQRVYLQPRGRKTRPNLGFLVATFTFSVTCTVSVPRQWKRIDNIKFIKIIFFRLANPLISSFCSQQTAPHQYSQHNRDSDEKLPWGRELNRVVELFPQRVVSELALICRLKRRSFLHMKENIHHLQTVNACCNMNRYLYTMHKQQFICSIHIIVG